jgi:hypothetical protein
LAWPCDRDAIISRHRFFIPGAEFDNRYCAWYIGFIFGILVKKEDAMNFTLVNLLAAITFLLFIIAFVLITVTLESRKPKSSKQH